MFFIYLLKGLYYNEKRKVEMFQLEECYDSQTDQSFYLKGVDYSKEIEDILSKIK